MTKTFKNTFLKIKSFIRKVDIKKRLFELFVLPFYLITHPLKGYEEFKLEKKGKMWVAITYILLMILSMTLKQTSAGFLVSTPSITRVSILKTALFVIVPVCLIALGNWAITTLFDGKGHIKEIFIMLGYSLAPYVWLSIPMIGVSNFLIAEELQIYHVVLNIGIFGIVYLAFFGFLVLHEFGLFKNIVTLIATLIAIMVILFVGLLVLSLLQQIYGFLEQVYKEYIMRTS